MVQYADDTTIILDGSRDSLQATLNVLETYGLLSGLRVNTEKTKIIWIGKKKHSKDKLLISAKHDWGSSEFNLLGIDFSVDLERILQMHYTNIGIETREAAGVVAPNHRVRGVRVCFRPPTFCNRTKLQF